MIRTGIAGAAGKMGKTLIALIQESAELELTAALERRGHRSIGTDAGELAGAGTAGVPVSDDPDCVAAGVDVLVDFTIAPATVGHLEICSRHNTCMVIGTTGLGEDEVARLHAIGAKLPIVFASNYSIGVNITFRLVEMAAAIFGDAVDVEIIESHHRHKVDAPSGTALGLGEQVAKASGRKVPDVAVFGREGMTGARRRDTIGFHAIRGGDVVGEHTVIFAGAGERLEITHRAQSRNNFAEGALRAAAWIAGQSPGVYRMLDVLGMDSRLPR